MINAEKYKEEIKKINNEKNSFGVDEKTGEIKCCLDIVCNNCLFSPKNNSMYCGVNTVRWLLSECEEPLSDDEITILKNINKDYKWIARDGEIGLQIFTIKPFKSGQSCFIDNYGVIKNEWANLSAFNHLFQGVKAEDEEPHSIDELLKKHGVER